jgi:hypothetical protein
MEKIVEPSLDRLLRELNSFQNLGNPRLTILGLQLYSEHYVNEILMQKLEEPMKKGIINYLPFPQKLKILEKMGVVDKKRKSVLFCLSSLRNIIVHQLVFSIQELNNELKKTKLGFRYWWTLNEESGKFVKSQDINLEEVYQDKIKDKFIQLIISTILTIGLLYDDLNRLKGQKSKELIEVSFKKKENRWVFFLQVYKLPQNK